MQNLKDLIYIKNHLLTLEERFELLNIANREDWVEGLIDYIIAQNYTSYTNKEFESIKEENERLKEIIDDARNTLDR
jgi:hypothetical protein